MKILTSNLMPPALNWAVSTCEGVVSRWFDEGGYATVNGEVYSPSTDWAQGGPIIEREKISLEFLPGAGDTGADIWVATRIERPAVSEEQGPTALIAAMRCYVASQLGDEVDVPDELVSEETEQ